MGHRGMGSSATFTAAAPENTMRSFHMASQYNMDIIEFDVHLSIDNTLHVYHDFHYNRSADGTLLQIAECSWEELRAASGISEQPEEDQHFPKLEQLLKELPPSLGLNVELKVPMRQRNGAWSSGLYGTTISEAQSRTHCYSLNRFIDKLLEELYRHAGTSRFVMLSCFNPEAVAMLRLKQNHFPVLFIGRGTARSATINADRDLDHIDPRCGSVLELVRWALRLHLDGIVTAVGNYLCSEGEDLALACAELPWFVWGLRVWTARKFYKTTGYGLCGSYDR